MSPLIIEKLFMLPIEQALSPHISIRKMDELAILVIEHPQVKASIALQGAHLLSWQPAGAQQAIWLSNETAFKTGTAIRGGIPICWPWFGPAGKPSHGFARNQLWTLMQHSDDQAGVNLTLKLIQNEETLSLWPHDFTLLAHFTLGKQCKISLEAQGDYRCTAALHSYLAVTDIQQVDVGGLGKHYIDKVAQGAEAEQNGNLHINAQTDRIYTQPEVHSHMTDHAMPRTIDVHHHGHSDVVVWNPWQAVSASMADMADEGYRTMICVETAHISQPLIAQPNRPATLGVTLSLY